MHHTATGIGQCYSINPFLSDEGESTSDRAGSVGPILIYGSEHSEPSDQIDRFTRREGISHELRNRIIETLCGIPSIAPDCGRKEVSHFSVNVGEAAVEFLEGHEAADILFRAFRKVGKPQYQREQVFDIACQQPLVQCSRGVLFCGVMKFKSAVG